MVESSFLAIWHPPAEVKVDFLLKNGVFSTNFATFFRAFVFVKVSTLSEYHNRSKLFIIAYAQFIALSMCKISTSYDNFTVIGMVPTFVQKIVDTRYNLGK